MAHIVADNLWFCSDCTFVAVNGDYPNEYYYGEQEALQVRQAVDKDLLELGGYATANFDSETGEGIKEFSSRSCDCCHEALAGSRHRFTVLDTTGLNRWLRWPT